MLILQLTGCSFSSFLNSPNLVPDNMILSWKYKMGESVKASGSKVFL